MPVPHHPPMFMHADRGVWRDVSAQLVCLLPTPFVIISQQNQSVDILPIAFLPIFLWRVIYSMLRCFHTTAVDCVHRWRDVSRACALRRQEPCRHQQALPNI